MLRRRKASLTVVARQASFASMTTPPFKISVGLDIKGNWQDRPLDFLRELKNCTTTLVDQLESQAVALARSQGASWTDVGTALGISRQAAWDRFAGED